MQVPGCPRRARGLGKLQGGGIKIRGFASWEWQSPRGAAKQDASQDPGLSSEVQGREIAFFICFPSNPAAPIAGSPLGLPLVLRFPDRSQSLCSQNLCLLLKFTSFLEHPVHVPGAFTHQTKKLWHNPDILVLNLSRAPFPSDPATGRSAKGELWVEKWVTSPGGCCTEQQCKRGTG